MFCIYCGKKIHDRSRYCIYCGKTMPPDSLKVYDYDNKLDKDIVLYDSVENRAGYSAFIIEDAYRSEIENFLNVVAGKEKAKYSFEQDKRVLSIIDEIEESEDNLK